MRYFMRSTDPRYVEAFKVLRAEAGARIRFFQEKAREWGFDEISAEEFGGPTSFFKRVSEGDKASRGPAVEGFKGGERMLDEKGYFFRYSLHGRNKRATELVRQLRDAPPVPAELNDGKSHFRRNIASVFCARFSLPNNVWTGNSLGFALVHLLVDDVLVCSLPYREDDTKEAAPAVFPTGFEEITERVWAADIDRHNKSVKEGRA